jgi:tetratricopeptide (TPR) repeat protein
MAIEGELKEVGLADICQLLAMGRKTGCLSVTDRSNFGYVYFDEGVVVHATVLNRPDRLGELLVHNEVVVPEALDQARSRAAQENGTHYAHLLVEEGDLSPQELERFVRIEVEEAVYQLFSWEDGSFRFRTGERPDGGVPATVTIPAENLLLEGARRVDEWTQIRTEVSSREVVFTVVNEPPPQADLTPQQSRVLDLVDAKRTVGRITRESGLVEFEAARALFDMVREGWIQAVDSPVPDGEKTERSEIPPARRHLDLARAFQEEGLLDEAERELQTALEHDPTHAEALSRLAVISLRRERPREALQNLDRADEADGLSYPRLRNRAVALELMGQLRAALEVLDQGQDLSEGDEELELARGILLFKLGRGREALEALHRYREGLDEGVPPPVYFAYAILAAELAGESQEAMHLGREGLEHHPGAGPVLVNLGVVLERRGEAAAAEALYLRAVGETRTPPQAHRNLGDLALRRGDQASARAHYERAIRLDPELGDQVFLKLGTLFYEEGDRDTAQRLWRRALQLNPDNQVARTNLGMAGTGVGG